MSQANGFVRITATRTIPILYPTLAMALRQLKPGERVARAQVCYLETQGPFNPAITIAVL